MFPFAWLQLIPTAHWPKALANKVVVLLLQLVQKFGVKHPVQPWFDCVVVGVQAVPVTAKLIVFKKHFPYLRTNPLAHSLHYPEV